MEKVKITQEQADTIERLKEHHRGEIERFKRNPNQFADWLLPVKDMQVEDIEKAYRGGYEVEPQFKVGDLIKDKNVDGVVIEITSISNGRAGYHVFWMSGSTKIDTFVNKDNAVLLTDGEIATEKTRRWWAKHDRNVWELKGSDVLSNTFTGERKIIFSVYKEAVSFYGLVEEVPINEIMKNYKVSYFSEDRKDI